MKYFIKLLLISSLTLTAGCIAKGRVDITMTSPKQALLNLNVAQVRVQNNQLIITGTNLNSVTQVKLVNSGITQTFTVESGSSTQLIANGISAVSIGVGKVFDMILSNASAAATVPVTFTLNNKSVTGTMLSNMSAQNGEVLTFNGTDWAPASPVDPQLYKGTWDPTVPGSIPNVGTAGNGDYWVISKSGMYAGNGVTYAAGDWIIEDSGAWVKVPMSTNSVTSYNGNKGIVVTLPSDYVLLKNGSGKLPGSSLNDLANVDLTTVPPVNGNVLKYNGVAWVPGTAGGAAGAIGSTEITDLSITGADIAENTINPSKIYSSSMDAALYLRGDKTWANFAADTLNVPLSTYSLNATVKPVVGITDKIGAALGKIQKFLNDIDSDYVSKTATSQVVSGTFSFTSPTSFLYTQLPSGASPTEVANVQYVQNYVTAAVATSAGSSPATLTTVNGAVSAAATTLTVASTTGYPSIGTLLIGSEAITYTGKTATTFTGLTRGAYGTSAAGIANSASVNNYLSLSSSSALTTPKMVITGSGNVGIGTASPSGLFEIQGGQASSGSGKSISLIAQSGQVNGFGPSGGSINLTAGFSDSGGGQGGNITLTAGDSNQSSSPGKIILMTGQNGSLGGRTHVGINTSSTIAALTVLGDYQGPANNAAVIAAQRFWTPTAGMHTTISFSSPRTTGGMTNFGEVGAESRDVGNATYKGDLVFKTVNQNVPAEQMRIDYLGNVGIGTSNPAVALDLNSKTDSIRVPSGTTAQRPAAPVVGDIRFNSTLGTLEAYVLNAWKNLSQAVMSRGNISSTPYTLTSADGGVYLSYNHTANGIINLPDISTLSDGWQVIIIRKVALSVTIKPFATDTFLNGQTNLEMQGNNLQSVTITKIGSNWAITNQTTDCILGKACWGAGQIYAGTYLGHQYFVTPGGCTNSTTPTCAGGTDTVTKVWGSAAPELNVMQNLTEAIDGADQSKILATLTTATAAQFCENMDYGGFQDWYLPARQEMLFIQRNSSTIGGFAEISGYYTSTEYSATTNWFVSFSQGYMYTGNKNTAGQFVRCVRRY